MSADFMFMAFAFPQSLASNTQYLCVWLAKPVGIKQGAPTDMAWGQCPDAWCSPPLSSTWPHCPRAQTELARRPAQYQHGERQLVSCSNFLPVEPLSFLPLLIASSRVARTPKRHVVQVRSLRQSALYYCAWQVTPGVQHLYYCLVLLPCIIVQGKLLPVSSTSQANSSGLSLCLIGSSSQSTSCGTRGAFQDWWDNIRSKVLCVTIYPYNTKHLLQAGCKTLWG